MLCAVMTDFVVSMCLIMRNCNTSYVVMFAASAGLSTKVASLCDW